MGVVYEAFQEGLDRPVAVKALDTKLARSKEIVERFRREGRAYAKLRHEAIVQVHDLVEKDDGLYLVTELVDGTDLAKLLAQGGALPPDCVALVGARVADALDYVHFNALLHRDVKPANVMVSRDGEVKLMDFGIAKGEDDASLTRAGMLVGSPSYMAPEVLAGGEAGPLADVWALGVSLYELLTGEKPFRGKDAEDLFAAIARGKFPAVRTLAPDCPRRLARAVERCLARRPAARFKSAGALARALDATREPAPAARRPPARARRRAPREPRLRDRGDRPHEGRPLDPPRHPDRGRARHGDEGGVPGAPPPPREPRGDGAPRPRRRRGDLLRAVVRRRPGAPLTRRR